MENVQTGLRVGRSESFPRPSLDSGVSSGAVRYSYQVPATRYMPLILRRVFFVQAVLCVFITPDQHESLDGIDVRSAT